MSSPTGTGHAWGAGGREGEGLVVDCADCGYILDRGKPTPLCPAWKSGRHRWSEAEVRSPTDRVPDAAPADDSAEFWPWSEKPLDFGAGKEAGRAAGMLLAHKKADAEPVTRKLGIRARILRDMAWAVGQGGPGIPALREANVKMAADELDAAAEIIQRLASTVPRTALDEMNEEWLSKALLALRVIEDGPADPVLAADASWAAGVATSALASLKEAGLDA